MKLHYGRRLFCLFLLALVLSACATGQSYYQAGVEASKNGEFDRAVDAFSRAVEENPSNNEYRARLVAASHRAAWEHLEKGRALRADGKYLEAIGSFRLAEALNPTLQVATKELRQTKQLQLAREMLSDAQEFYRARRMSQAREKAREVLELDPENSGAQELLDKIRQDKSTIVGGYELDVESKKPITLKFKDAQLEEVFKILSQLSGINFIFDEDLRNEKVTLLLEDATFAQALELLMKMNNLGSRILNPKTVIIYSNTKDKQKQYEDQIIQTFYLSSIEAKKAVNMLRTMLQLRKIYVHEELNAIVVRDNPDVVQLVAEILRNADLADSEVVFDLELIEVNYGNTLDLGMDLSTYSVSVGAGQGGRIVSQGLESGGDTSGLVSSASNLELFYTLPTATFDLQKQRVDSDILATPKIRVKNREKGKVHVGTREPTVTSTVTGDNVTENVQYIDVGVKVDVEPIIQLDGTIRTKLRLEVSSADPAEETTTSRIFTINTTNAESTLILKDGERTVLGGLIREVDVRTKTTIPIIGDIPLIGSLFTHYIDEDARREILLSVTPYIVRKVAVPNQAESRIWSGGEEELRAGPNFAAFAELPDFDAAPAPAPADKAAPASEPQPETDGQPAAEPAEPRDAAAEQPPESETGVIVPVVPAESTPVATATAAPDTTGQGTAQPGSQPGEEQVAQVQIPDTRIATPAAAAELFLRGPQLVNSGEEFSVELVASEIDGLYSAPMFINYDPQLVDFVRADEGDFLKEVGKSTVFTSSPNRSRGEIIIGHKQGSGGSGASGSGTLASLYFKAKAAGKVVIRPNRVNFRDATGNRLTVNSKPLQIEIR